MPKIKIDHREIEVPPGTTVLEAARALGIDIPTLCSLQGYRPATSCLVCLVKDRATGRMMPSCATAATDGLEVDSETTEVHQLRRTSLELLLGDHFGDCLAPCFFACPAHMNISRMLHQIAAGDNQAAIETIKRDIALPAVLGRVCPRPCEKACRRTVADSPVAICRLKQQVADLDLAGDSPFRPQCLPPSGKRVAIIGAGPTGLAAAYYLAQRGHAVSLFDDQEKPGGRLRHEFSADLLPSAVLDAEIASILLPGVELRLGRRVGEDISLAELQSQFQAVLIACGAAAKDEDAAWNVEVGPRGIAVNHQTYATSAAGVFAAGNAIRGKGLVVRSTADGKEAAAAIDQFLTAHAVIGTHLPFSTKIGKVGPEAIPLLLEQSSPKPRWEPADPQAAFEALAAREQAGRCLHCDCRGLEECHLRRYAAKYGADPNRYAGERRHAGRIGRHHRVIYEPGKCINCGLCIQIAEAAAEPVGVTFVGRGFDARVGVPFGRSWDTALVHVADQCVAACPTAALWIDEDHHRPIMDDSQEKLG